MPNARPITSPALDHNEKWSVDLSRQQYEVTLDYNDGTRGDVPMLNFEDPRKNVANLVKRQVATSRTIIDPQTGQPVIETTTRDIYSFIYGAEDVNQSGLRFGIRFSAAFRGVHVVRVYPDMPSTRCMDNEGRERALEPGDRIITVNSQAISGLDSMLEAIAASPRQMGFVVINRRTGRPVELSTELAW